MHEVCVYAINVGVGSHALLGCRPVLVPSGSPFGNLEHVGAGPNALDVSGWVIDPDTAASTDVHVYVDGRGVAVKADGHRPDVGQAYPAFGPEHGFSFRMGAAPGLHQVCVYGINAGVGGHSLLGCRQVVVPSGPPLGNLELVRPTAGAVNVAGWALDPDSGDPIDVHVYVDSAGVSVRADRQRGDVGAVFPGYGPNHGFSGRVPASPGPHQVCAYAINVNVGHHTLLGCQQAWVR